MMEKRFKKFEGKTQEEINWIANELARIDSVPLNEILRPGVKAEGGQTAVVVNGKVVSLRSDRFKTVQHKTVVQATEKTFKEKGQLPVVEVIESDYGAKLYAFFYHPAPRTIDGETFHVGVLLRNVADGTHDVSATGVARRDRDGLTCTINQVFESIKRTNGNFEHVEADIQDTVQRALNRLETFLPHFQDAYMAARHIPVEMETELLNMVGPQTVGKLLVHTKASTHGATALSIWSALLAHAKQLETEARATTGQPSYTRAQSYRDLADAYLMSLVEA